MAAAYIKEMHNIQQSGPYHVLGWSFGGHVAQEMAVQLQDQGEQVALIIMDAYPVSPEVPLVPEDLEAMSEPGDSGERDDGRNDEREDDEFYEAKLADMTSEVRQEVLGISDAEVAIFSRILKNNTRARTSHVPRPFAGSLLLFVAEENHPNGELAADKWKLYISGEISHTMLHCKHEDMTQSEMLAQVWDRVSTWLGLSDEQIG
jgi:thioesterase domain-containing protein